MVLLLILAISIFVIGADKVASIINLSAYTNMINVQITMIITFCILMSCTTNSSISLEGKSLWILKSLPIDEIDIFKSKLLLNILLVLPISLLSFFIISIKLKFDIIYTITMIGLIIACTLFTSLYGLFINLIYPKTDYISETEVVKRSASTMISIFSSIGYLGLYAVAYYFLKLEFNILLILGTIITLIIDLVLWKFIKTKGVKLFRIIV
jgi:ABC-2 type transport system permease protein